MRVCECRFLVIMSGTIRRVISDETLGMSKRVQLTATTQNYQLILTFQLHFAFFRPSDTLACLAIQKSQTNVRFVKVLTMRPPREREFRWLMKPFLVRLVLLNVFHSKLLDFHREGKKSLLPGATTLPVSVSRLSPHHSFSTDRNILC